MKAKSRHGGLVVMLVLVIVSCFIENMARSSTKVSSHEHVRSYLPRSVPFALYNKDKMLKSFPSYNEYRKRFNLASVDVWQTARSKSRDGFITLSIKSMHFFVSKFVQLRYSISTATPVSRSWTCRIIFWVTLTRSVSSMANDTTL
ncbi:hypothetical protein CARUB_v10021116mg [Capsella rubella]|uniref:Uncharacterized protein n=1 Tax=Capsella rubella TaxID=81985 RepID=R0GCJ9_9BRAS|nr:uncharacterized protein LOC17894690 [Capsella rubella]EOA33462.1 hypothetical protein CARUB_v10021116mg [Capsella rubella]